MGTSNYRVTIWSEFTDLLFPQRCFGCAQLGTTLCALCRGEFSFQPVLRKIDGLKIFSASYFAPVSRKILLRAKEDGIRSADLLVVEALRFSVTHATSNRKVLLQAIPSQRNKIRLRGRSFVTSLVQEICNTEVEQIQLLEFQRRVFDQSELSAQERSKNMAGALCVKAKKFPISQEIFLVDDLVTTGSTLLEARRALNVAGFTVAGAITAFSA